MSSKDKHNKSLRRVIIHPLRLHRHHSTLVTTPQHAVCHTLWGITSNMSYHVTADTQCLKLRPAGSSHISHFPVIFKICFTLLYLYSFVIDNCKSFRHEIWLLLLPYLQIKRYCISMVQKTIFFLNSKVVHIFSSKVVHILRISQTLQ